MFRDFPAQNRDPCLGDSSPKSHPLEPRTPVYHNTWVPPPPPPGFLSKASISKVSIPLLNVPINTYVWGTADTRWQHVPFPYCPWRQRALVPEFIKTWLVSDERASILSCFVPSANLEISWRNLMNFLVDSYKYAELKGPHVIYAWLSLVVTENKACCSAGTSDPRGGVLRCCLDGGARLKPPNPCPSLRVILAEKGTPLLGIFSQENYVFVYFSDKMGENI